MPVDPLVVAVKFAILVLLLAVATPPVILCDRRASSMVPRAGRLVRPVVDVFKLVSKGLGRASGADRILHLVAPTLALMVVLAPLVVVPLGRDDGLLLFGRQVGGLGVAPDMPLGLLFILAFASLGVFPSVLASWSSRSAAAMVGGVRSIERAVIYGVALALSLVGVVMAASSANVTEVIASQGRVVFEALPAWNLLIQPLGAAVFAGAWLALLGQPPFDGAEVSPEIPGGFLESFSGAPLAVFLLSRPIGLITCAVLTTALFLGGWQLPWLALPGGWIGALLSILVFCFKVGIVLWFLIRVGSLLPRLTPAGSTAFAWKVLIPLSAVNLVWVGAAMAGGFLS